MTQRSSWTLGHGDARRDAIVAFIVDHIVEHQRPPTVREIGEAVGLSSSATVFTHLRILAKEGVITLPPKGFPRGLVVNTFRRDALNRALRLVHAEEVCEAAERFIETGAKGDRQDLERKLGLWRAAMDAGGGDGGSVGAGQLAG